MTIIEKIALIESVPNCTFTSAFEEIDEEFSVEKDVTPTDLPVALGDLDIPCGVEIYLNGDLYTYAKGIKYLNLGDIVLGKIVAFVSNKENFYTPKFNTITLRYNDDLGGFNDVLIDKVKPILVSSEVSIEGNIVEKLIYFEAETLEEL